ncbi:MAG: anion permease [Rhodanobacteraceae bacterium]|nr:anion permease [Rhodanobacteraceae bacterium]
MATRCLTREQAYRSIEWPVIILLAALIPLGTAMEKHGLASGAAQIVMQVVGEHGPLAALAAIYLSTALLTEVMSNNAAAVLLAPIAISMATALRRASNAISHRSDRGCFDGICDTSGLPDQYHGLPGR